MRLLRRHKSVLIALGIYWPMIFWLTHMPMPVIMFRSGLSDKTMHAMAYFALTFLVWFAVSPYHRVRWNKKKVWFVLVFVACYGVIDEILQGFVSRSVEALDFAADLLGAFLSLILLTIAGFWTALLIASAVFIFIVSNLSYLLTLYPQYHLNIVFHATAYTAFTLIWIQHIERHSSVKPAHTVWPPYSLLIPAGLLLTVKATAPVFDKAIDRYEVAAALFGIGSAVFISWLTMRLSRKAR